MTNDLTIYISLGNQTYVGINESDELVIFTTKLGVIRDYVILGKLSKAKIEEIKDYFDRLSIHAKE